MLQIHATGFHDLRVMLACDLCHAPFGSLAECWTAFHRPAAFGPPQAAIVTHRRCLTDRRLRETFGTAPVTWLRGVEAFQQVFRRCPPEPREPLVTSGGCTLEVPISRGRRVGPRG